MTTFGTLPKIEEIKPEYDRKIFQIIKSVGAEYGAIGDGFGPSDLEVLCMSQHYKDENNSIYWVAIINGQVVGGSGIAAFNGSSDICELRKLFLLPESRGLGLGKALTLRCLSYAKAKGYKQCYLDTLSSMKSAISLYEKLGFKRLLSPLDGTEHSRCDIWMIKEL
ncbi:MAG: GNAT family N-acetyltransferase [Cyanothece sp. SIO1E1]|nr:GNAT family N-acetyltransferase [Cyanothece sp. SIO1E1]